MLAQPVAVKATREAAITDLVSLVCMVVLLEQKIRFAVMLAEASLQA
jgi:hypothetical protein